MVVDEKAVFVAALALPDAGEREAYLQQACAGHPELLDRLRELLSAHEESQGPLDRGPGATVDAGPAESAGTVIGPYKLVQQVGEGGMGAVWMAQQTEPVKRLVAVKLIKAGMDSKQVIARFEAERQALALMDHPNIAKVLDGGTTGAGRPYFVMDLVKGVPITRYCDEHRLTPRQRLELFLPVCSAVQHAHQKGIIHRDLKPSNVLVALYDGRPVPKVIDFGVAKATGQQLTDRTLVTGFGAIVGTFEYMSPEQAEINQLDIDTRSDIYSLGVLLYELLAGSPPFTSKELERAGVLEMLRVIREQEPSRPSTKLNSSDALPTLSANRGTELAKLTQLVRGELDWIVMKALEKDRGRRYETANGFAMDVQRYLADEPVLACPPTAGYRLRKFARRNRAAITAAAVVLAALLLGLLGTIWQALRATDAEHRARVEEEAARRESDLADTARRDAERHADDAKKKAKEADESLRLLGKEKAETDRLFDLSRRHLFTSQLRVVAPLVEEDPQRARQLLDDCNAFPLDLRDFTWGNYARLCRREQLAFRYDAVPVFSPADGDTFALVNGARIEVRHRDQGRLIHVLPLRHHIHGAAFSPDGTLLLAVDRPGGELHGELRAWDVKTGTLELTIPEVDLFWFSPDSSHLIARAGTDTPTLRLVDRKGGDKKDLLRGEDAKVGSLRLDPGNRVFVCSAPNEDGVWLRDTAAGKLIASLPKGTRCDFTPDGRVLVAGHEDRIELRDPASGKVLKTIADVEGPHLLSPDGRLLAFRQRGKGNRLALWDVRRGAVVATLPAEAACGFTPDGGRLITLSSEPRRMQLWQVPAGRLVRTFAQAWDGVRPLSPDCTAVVESGGNQTIRVRDLVTGKLRATLAVPEVSSGRVQFSPDGRTLTKERIMWDVSPDPGCTTLGDVVPVFDERGHIGSYERDRPASDPLLGHRGRTLAYLGEGRLHLRDLAANATRLRLEKVSAFTLSPDESILASSDADGVVTLRDAHTGKVRAVLERLPRAPHQLHFSGDGSLLVTVILGRAPRERQKGHEPAAGLPPRTNGSPRRAPPPEPLGEIRVWDAGSGKLRAVLKGHTKALYDAAFSPAGDLLVAASADDTVRLWDVRTGALRTSLKGVASYLGFTPDGRRLVTWAGAPHESGRPADEGVEVRDVASGKLLSRFPLPSRSAVGRLRSRVAGLTPGGDGVLVVTTRIRSPSESWESSEVRVLDATTGKPRFVLEGADGPLAFSADGQTIAACSGYRDRRSGAWNATQIKLYDAVTGQDRGAIDGHILPVSALAFTPDSRTLISGDGKTVRLWQTGMGFEPVTLRTDPLRYKTSPGERTLALSADGRTLAAVDSQRAELLELTSGRQVVTIDGAFGQRPFPALSADGGLLAVASSPGDGKRAVIRLWNARTGAPVGSLDCPGLVVRKALFFSGDGKRLRALLADGTIRGWDVTSLNELPPGVARADFPRKYLFKLTGGINEHVEDREHQTRTTGHGKVEVVDLATGKPLVTLAGHKSPVGAVAVHPRRPRVASAGGLWQMYYHRPPSTWNYYIPGELRVWDLNTGKELAALTGFPDALQHLAYSPDGGLLVGAHQRDDRHPADLLFWDADTLRPVGRVHVRRVHDLAFTPDGKRLVFCTEDTIQMLNLERLLGTAAAALPKPGPGKQP